MESIRNLQTAFSIAQPDLVYSLLYLKVKKPYIFELDVKLILHFKASLSRPGPSLPFIWQVLMLQGSDVATDSVEKITHLLVDPA